MDLDAPGTHFGPSKAGWGDSPMLQEPSSDCRIRMIRGVDPRFRARRPEGDNPNENQPPQPHSDERSRDASVLAKVFRDAGHGWQ